MLIEAGRVRKSVWKPEIEMARSPHNTNRMPSHRVMAYCHDSVGIGHLRRTMSICERISREHHDSSFLLATGTPYVPLFNQVPRVDYVKLPALEKEASGSYGSKFLNISLSQIIRCRKSMLMRAAEHLEPDVLLVDKAPLGVCRELVPTLRWLRRHRPNTRIIFGMRDIEDSSEATIRQWDKDGVLEVLDTCFDEIWIYGMAEVFNPLIEYRIPPSIGRKVRFMGYVTRDQPAVQAAPVPAQRRVLVTVGGGTDGEALIEAYLAEAAGRLSDRGIATTIVGGPDLPSRAANRLRDKAATIAAVEWVDFEPCMSGRIAQANLIVSMGGYNTLCEIALQHKPVLVIPRIRPRLEQAIRAERWSQLGGVFSLPPPELTPTALSRRVIDLLESGPEVVSMRLDLRGLDRVAERFQEFWSKDHCHATPVCL